jgi:arabinan endo-1,5-alpha-L-arabinosidase
VFKNLLVVAGLLANPKSTVAQASGDPTNPLTGSVGIHDPSAVIKDGNTYYIYATGGGSKTSTNRTHWVGGSRVFSSNPSWWATQILPPDNPQLWAGDISYWNGTYYFYYSVSAWYNFHSCIGLATNTTLNPASPNYRWVDRGIVIDSARGHLLGGNRVNVIDPNLFQDPVSGKKYLNFGSYQGGVRQVEIDPATGLMVNAANPQLTKITNALGEGSFLFYANGYYYYTVSRGGCCNGMSSTYQVVYGRSTTVGGPYTTQAGTSFLNNNYTVLLTRDNAADGSVLHAGMGGQSFFVDHDTLFMSYHAYTAPSGNSLLNIRPVYRTSANWLTLNPAQGTVITLPSTNIQIAEKMRINAAGSRGALVFKMGPGRLFDLNGRILGFQARLEPFGDVP